MKTAILTLASIAVLWTTPSAQDPLPTSPLVLEYTETGPEDWITDVTEVEAGIRIRTAGSAEHAGTWTQLMFRVYVDSSYFDENDPVTMDHKTFLSELPEEDIVTLLGLGPEYANAEPVVTGGQQFVTQLTSALTPVDPLRVATYCLPTLRVPNPNYDPILDPVANLDTNTLWKTSHDDWSGNINSWWVPYRTGATGEQVIDLDALVEDLIVQQSGGVIDSSFFGNGPFQPQSPYYKEMRDAGLYVKVQALGLKGYWTSSSSYPDSDAPGTAAPDGLQGWAPFAPRIVTSKPVTIQMAATIPREPYPDWSVYSNSMSFLASSPGAITTIRVANRYANPKARLKHVQSGLSAVVELSSIANGRSEFTMPMWPTGTVRIDQLMNDVGVRNLPLADQWVYALQ